MTREPFDWRAFRKTFLLQPVPVWIVSAFALEARREGDSLDAARVLRGTGAERGLNVAFVLYALILPAAAALIVYLLAGRRRMTKQLRLMGDWCLALVLLASVANAYVLAHQARANWTAIGPGLTALRAACWK